MTNAFFKKLNPFDFFLLLCSFLYGNIFALQCSEFDWGFFLIFGVVFFIETLEKFVYMFFKGPHEEKKLNTTKTFFFISWFCSKISKIRPKKTFFGPDDLGFLRKKNTNVFFVRHSPFFLLNSLKRGFLLGFFVEAFKVGS